MTLPGLSDGAVSASQDLPEVPAAGSVLLVVPGLISVLRVPTSLTQNYNTHTHRQYIPVLKKWLLLYIHDKGLKQQCFLNLFFTTSQKVKLNSIKQNYKPEKTT